MTYKKPQITVTQNFLTSSTPSTTYLPTVVLGPRYDVVEEKLLTAYNGTEVTANYPEIVSGNVVDTSYISILAKSASLEYYISADTAHVWKKNGRYSNKIRTLLSTNLRFPPGEDSIFKSRGVLVGDRVKVSRGATVVDSTVTAIEADMSASSTGTATANAGNTATQAHAVDAAASGPGQSSITPSSGGTYVGDLYDNVITDTYTIFTSVGGVAPVYTTTPTGLTNHSCAITGTYDCDTSDTYTFTVIQGGSTDATYSITSANLDNSGLMTDLVVGAPLALGSKGLYFQLTLTGSDLLIAGEQFTVAVAPSAARLRITTTSGTDEVSSRVFPGFGVAFTVGTRGVTLSLAGTTLVAGYYWTIECDKQLAAVTSTSAGTYTGTVDKTYFIEVVQGGLFAEALIEISNSINTTKTTKAVPAHTTPITIGDGVTLAFSNNVQGGVILGDIFTIACVASKATYYRTLVMADSMPSSFDTPTISASSAPVGTNTCTPGGTYLTTNPALELYSSETYVVQITTAGISGVAKAILVSSSGYDNVLTPFTVTTGAPVSVGAYGLELTFAIVAPAVEFVLADVWSFTVTKVSVDVNLYMQKTSVELSNDYYAATSSNVTIEANAKVLDSSWSAVEELLIDTASLYITYRALHTAGANVLYSIASSDDITTYLGTDHIDNPIARGARYALDNASSQSIKAIYPTANTALGFGTTLTKLEYYNNQNVYHIALLSNEDDIITATIAHINKMITKNKWRRLYISKQIPAIFDVVSGNCTIIENVNDPGVYDIVRVETASFASVASGNTFNFLGAEYTVDTVNSNTELKLVEDVGAAHPIATPYSITKVPTVTDKVTYQAAKATGYNSRFISYIVPDSFIGYSSETHPSYYLTAVVAGMKAGLPPHQPITNVSTLGISSVIAMVNEFSEDQLDTMAMAGCLIITQDSETGTPYIRHQLTTDMSDVKHQEVSIVDNINDISYGIMEICEPYVGRYNIHPGVLNTIDSQLKGYMFELTGTVNEYAGPQILSHENLSVTQDPNQEDKILISVRVYCPAPVNYIDITLTV